ncbi:CNPY2 protein, partial [Urocolius indicus]|nr:CNPY2 protein [Urocolius indicus]
LAAALAALLPPACARRSQDLHCGACRALVDELEWEIARVDPRKTIQMGSFRINPDGSQSVVEVRRPQPSPGIAPQPHTVGERLSSGCCPCLPSLGGCSEPSPCPLQCESIAEEYEDELIEFLSHEADNVKDRLCSKRTDLCDHALHIPHDEL